MSFGVGADVEGVVCRQQSGGRGIENEELEMVRIVDCRLLIVDCREDEVERGEERIEKEGTKIKSTRRKDKRRKDERRKGKRGDLNDRPGRFWVLGLGVLQPKARYGRRKEATKDLPKKCPMLVHGSGPSPKGKKQKGEAIRQWCQPTAHSWSGQARPGLCNRAKTLLRVLFGSSMLYAVRLRYGDCGFWSHWVLAARAVGR